MKSLKILDSESKTMSSLEIAKLTGKAHKNVLRDIRDTLEATNVDALKFELRHTEGLNKGRIKEYILPKRECDLIVSGYEPKYRLAIIDRWQELEITPKVQTEYIESELEIKALRDKYKKQEILAEYEFLKTLAEMSGRSFDINQYTDTIGITGQSKETLKELKTLVGGSISEFGGIDKPHSAATTLLKDYSLRIPTPDFNELLVVEGILTPERVVTEYGKRFGFNAQQGTSTQPRWYTDRFEELLHLVELDKQIGK